MKPLRIDVLANDGSPLGVTEESIHGLDGRMGVGGAELAILTLMRGWHDAGHQVRFYNNPKSTNGSAFRHLPISLFSPREDRDILIIFRSPNRKAINARGKKIWFSTDQYTVGDFREFSQHVDKIITISPFHANYFASTYNIQNTITIDLPVRDWEYNKPIPKVRDRLIFCSVPDRGLAILADCYDELRSAIPNLSLTVTSDYRLWGVESPRNEKYIRRFLGKSGVQFLGAVQRGQLIEEQLRAEIHAYPSIYPELFCYAVAECQIAGALPVTSTTGAISTTNMGIQVYGDSTSPHWRKSYIDAVISTLSDNKLREKQEEVRRLAKSRFSLERILCEWDKKVFYE